MRKRKIVLTQVTETGLTPEKPYAVHELHDTVDFDIGQRLTKREVETLLQQARTTVVVRPG
jgi:hypothetical protein